MAILTYNRLVEAGACRAQLTLFKRKFGESVIVTVEAAQEVAGEFSWDWAGCLLDASARRAYDEALASVRRAHGEALASARRAYDEALASAWAQAFIDSESRKKES